MRETASARKRYRGKTVDVSFDPLRCRHAAECLRGLPAVFDAGRRPWILPDGADPDEVVSVVARCPTGAAGTANAPYCDGSGTCADWPHPRRVEPS
jgi:uncharacterized Fe-S cluster protein YjdI